MATYLVWVDLGVSWAEREDATAEIIVRDHSPSHYVYVAGTFEWDGNDAGLEAARETARSIALEDVSRTMREADEYQRAVDNPFAIHFPRPPEGEHPMGAKVRALVGLGVPGTPPGSDLVARIAQEMDIDWGAPGGEL